MKISIIQWLHIQQVSAIVLVPHKIKNSTDGLQTDKLMSNPKPEDSLYLLGPIPDDQNFFLDFPLGPLITAVTRLTVCANTIMD